MEGFLNKANFDKQERAVFSPTDWNMETWIPTFHKFKQGYVYFLIMLERLILFVINTYFINYALKISKREWNITGFFVTH